MRNLKSELGVKKLLPEHGQVESDSGFGTALCFLSSLPCFSSFLEIGTWNGLGSTRIIMNSLMERKDDAFLLSIEACKPYYREALRNWRNVPHNGKLRLLYGRIAESFLTRAEVENHLVFAEPMAKQWFYATYEKELNIFHKAPDVTDALPDTIDVLLLDGSEYCSWYEYKKLEERSTVIVCDDTVRAIKNYEVRQDLMNSSSWRTLVDRPEERNGWFVACRNKLYSDLSDQWKNFMAENTYPFGK